MKNKNDGKFCNNSNRIDLKQKEIKLIDTSV